MLKNNLFSVLFVAIFSFVGMTAAQAQVTCAGSSGCPAGSTQIEVTNSTPCDYTVIVEYTFGGSISSTACTVTAGGTLVMCYNHNTTTITSAEVVDVSGEVAWVSNPGYPGNGNSSVSNGGCGGSDVFYWENFNSTGPGHVTNFIIQ